MLRSLFSGITGLRAHQNLMDVVGNNIANVNTTGFKASNALFEDTLSQTLKGAASPTTTTGGINPAQVGLGVQLAAITTNFAQGSAQNTGRSTDLMVQGDGFFIVSNGTEDHYTRSGAFTFDSTGKLVTSEGCVVQGWMANSSGVVNTDTGITGISVPAGTVMTPSASTSVTVGGNITAVTPVPTTATTMTLGVTVYDASGSAHPLSIVITQDLTDATGATWLVDATDSAVSPPVSVGTGTLGFNAGTGAYSSGSPLALTITAADGSTTTTVNVDLTGVTHYGGPKSIAVTAADGWAAGTLQQFQIGGDGSIVGIFSNEQKRTLAQVALANFNNPPGLAKVGNSAYRTTSNSGLPQIGTAGSGGRGQLMGGTLEMSNVDLAQEFTNLIIAQRGFQANSRVITTSDQLLQDLVDLKR